MSLFYFYIFSKELENLRDRYNTPGQGFGHFKLSLLDKINEYFLDARIKRETLSLNKKNVLEIMNYGKEKASIVAKHRIEEIRNLVGI